MNLAIKRTMDAAYLNRVANDPAVRPWLGGSGALDMQPILDNPKNVGLQAEGGGFVVINVGDGLYEWHSMFLPDHRGPNVLAAMEEGARYMFVETDCTEIITKCPVNNKGAQGAARAMGCAHVFTVEKGWNHQGDFIGMDCVSLTIERWAQRDKDAETWGVWFHDQLEKLTAEMGATIPVHYEEISHNKAAGAAVMMYRAGNGLKATRYYNRWAAHAGFPGVTLLGVNPVILDMHQVIVALRDNDLEILQVRKPEPVQLREVA